LQHCTKMSGASSFKVVAMCLVVLLAIGIRLYFKPLSNAAVEPVVGSSIFDFTVDTATEGTTMQLSELKGKKAYLVINVASKCGLTERNYAEMTQVYEKYR
jgi:hypothetical protein